MEARISLAKLICDFCFDTIIGHNSGVYKSFMMKKELDINYLRSPLILTLLSSATMNYLNNAYSSLIRKDDPYIINKFNEMCVIKNHSKICLLNIIFAIILQIESDIDRAKLDIDSYEKFMESLRKQTTNMYTATWEKLSNIVSHECHGEDIEKCDPNKPMFYSK